MIDYKALYIGVCNTCLSGKSVGKFAMKATEYQYKGGLSELYRNKTRTATSGAKYVVLLLL